MHDPQYRIAGVGRSRPPTTSRRTRASTSAAAWPRPRTRTSRFDRLRPSSSRDRSDSDLPPPPSCVCALVLAALPARAHDPFEITTDAHVSGDRMGLHTTMSLLTATRLCFTGADARKTIDVSEFPALRPALDDCARRFYRVSSGGDALPVCPSRRSRVTVEDDLDIKLSTPRPARSPLVFDAVFLPAPGGARDRGCRPDRDRRPHVPRPEGAASRRRRVRSSDNRRGRGPRHAAVAGIPQLRAARRRAHPDRRRPPAVSARPAGRLPPFPDRRRHRHLLHGRPLGHAGARGAGGRDAVRRGSSSR